MPQRKCSIFFAYLVFCHRIVRSGLLFFALSVWATFVMEGSPLENDVVGPLAGDAPLAGIAPQARVESNPWAANNLQLRSGELYIEYIPGETGFHLWVENKAVIGSILITDYTDDPNKKQPVYALRSQTYNIYNGDEKRLLQGKFLPKELYSLIDSTPETNPYFPRGAFHIFIPFTVVYGYAWSRNGSKTIGKGSWLNIRTFRKPYADYSAAFQDNPFVLSMPQLPEDPSANPKPDTKPKPETVQPKSLPKPTLSPSAAERAPEEKPSKPPKPDKPAKKPPAGALAALSDIEQKIEALSQNTIDVALVLDTTVSMRDNVEFLKKELLPLVQQKIEKFDHFRIGIVLYRDYGEEYLARPFAFRSNLIEVQELLNEITVRGGGDKPEAVHEAIYTALNELEWSSNKRLLIQVGDAPPHPKPKGEVTELMVLAKSRAMLVQLQQINLTDIEGEHNKKSLAKDRVKLAGNSTLPPFTPDFEPF